MLTVLRICVTAAAAFLAFGALFGCGYKTSPRPPTATVPARVGFIDAHGYPGKIVLRWAVPVVNTDGSELRDLSGFKVFRQRFPFRERCDDCDLQQEIHTNVDFHSPTNATIAQGAVKLVDTSVTPDSTYAYRVAAYNLQGVTGPLSETFTVDYAAPPPAPTGLTAEYERNGIKLKWDAPAIPAGIRYYRVYRGSSPNGEDLEPLGHTKWADPMYTDTSAPAEQAFYYRVRAVKVEDGFPVESPPSELVKGVLPVVEIEAPEKVLVMSTPDGIRVWWVKPANADKDTRYNVYRSSEDGPFRRINTTPVGRLSYLDRDVEKGKTYRYEVAAFPRGRPDAESTGTASEDLEYR